MTRCALRRWANLEERRRALTRPVVRTGDGDRRLQESPRSVRRMSRPRVGDPACLSGVRGAFGSGDRSRQLNTHSTEFRDVCYPWHPWFGRTVAVYEVLVKQGQSVSRCGLEEERNRRAIEVPTWMFEPAACRHLRLMPEPAVSYDALRGVQALLRIVPRSDPRGVLQAQHRSLPAAGGADAPVHDPPATLATDPVSSRTLTSVVSHITPRDPIEDGSTVGTVAPGARRPLGRGRPRTGGA
jgi:hypothetical protein